MSTIRGVFCLIFSFYLSAKVVIFAPNVSYLLQLSLRDNPLVVRFVRDMTLEPPSLLELAGRTVKLHQIPITFGDIPTTLINYLNAAQCCVNPKCRGWYKIKSLNVVLTYLAKQ